ncbi:MAG TPA: MFS transporter [Solirubrobacteraceae bacterium]|nr:MFS transporter [Solirubrobacteraceae bacterium]
MSTTSVSTENLDRRRWLALSVVCLAQLMIVLDTTIVNVALPSIQRELGFSQSELTWVINAFMITFGSLLLLAGRLGDLFGRRRIFLAGVAVFTTASVLCGASSSPAMLIAARLLQGAGGAMSASVILALIVTAFQEPGERARAMGAYMFTAVAGGSLGLIAGGVLTQELDWHWIFFVNVPIGVVTFVLGRALIPDDGPLALHRRVDWTGAALVTLSLMSGVYAITLAPSDGWTSERVLAFGAVAVALMSGFLALESRLRDPLLPLRILRLRGLVGSSVARAFLVTAMYTSFFLGTLYMERLLHFGALKTGLAWLPWTVTVAILSLGVTARLMRRFGALRLMVAGMTIVVGSALLLHGAGPHTAYFPRLFVAFIAGGLGVGLAFMPLLTTAMGEVPNADAGLGSAIVNVSQQLSGALGLAVLGSIATSRSRELIAVGHPVPGALLDGYHLAFALAALSALAAIVVVLTVLRRRPPARERVVAPALAREGERERQVA